MTALMRRCAIYTRKSTEEGLEQDFNSLDAQREACAAYIASQKGEGWVGVPDSYDDGGYSGGNTERPALRRLLQDIEAGKVNIIVVYKIDRLTRSLMDFSRLVEIFDRHGVTFVSVTQSFNTTTSMGRLTLNVLLSFAQFEREVTGERIRDKVLASKKKGMWMGGITPTGYDCHNHMLTINETEAAKIRSMFEKYLELGCVAQLKVWLDQNGIKTMRRISKAGRETGGKPFTRGNLYKILNNAVYAGKIPHKGQAYEGTHEALVSADVWEKVQRQLAAKVQEKAFPYRKAGHTDLLKGILYDSSGSRYTPTYTRKGERQYRYYISQNLLQYRDHPDGVLARLSAGEIEEAVIQKLKSCFVAVETAGEILGIDLGNYGRELHYIVEHRGSLDYERIVRQACKRVVINARTVTIKARIPAALEIVRDNLRLGIAAGPEDQYAELSIPFRIRRAKLGVVRILTEAREENLYHSLGMCEEDLKGLIQGIIWRDEHFGGMTLQRIADREGVSATHILKYVNKSIHYN